MIRRSSMYFFLSSLLLALSVTSLSISPKRGIPTSRFTTSSTARYMSWKDSQGNEILVGTVVQIVVPGLKAYHVKGKGFGLFEHGSFVPLEISESTGGRAKYLLLPVGMRGVVTKVFDVEGAVSSNLPVQVKFVPGEHVVEGLDPPVLLSMHFDPSEIVAVE